MVQLIAERGPNIDEIARLMGIHSESVRYQYRQMLRNGFVIQASCNYESLGMKRIIAAAELGDSFRGMADMAFFVLNQGGYLSSYARTRRGGFYILNAPVSQDCVDSWADLMHDLKKIGVFRSIESITLDSVRNLPMRADCFDFETGKWEFSLRKRGSARVVEVPSRVQKYDSMDLKIIEQLQSNANIPLTRICQTVGATNYKTFTWHFREHVFRRNLIKGYRVNWIGMRPANPRKVARRQAYVWNDIVANDLTESEKLELSTLLDSTPFVWVAGSGTRAYYARMVYPVEYAPKMKELLLRRLSSLGGRVRSFYMDPVHALHFSFETRNYDEKTGRWTLNKDWALQTLGSLGTFRGRKVHDALLANRTPNRSR